MTCLLVNINIFALILSKNLNYLTGILTACHEAVLLTSVLQRNRIGKPITIILLAQLFQDSLVTH